MAFDRRYAETNNMYGLFDNGLCVEIILRLR